MEEEQTVKEFRTHKVLNVSSMKTVNVDCYGYHLFNNGTNVVKVNGLPLPPGQAFSVGLDSQAHIKGPLEITFAGTNSGDLYIATLELDITC